MSAPTQVEQSVLEQISAELREAGRDMDAATLLWTRERYERLMDRKRDLAEARRRTAEWQAERGCGGLS